MIEESGQTLDKPWTRTVYDTPPIGQKKIRIGEDYCEIDVFCRERYTEELFSVLIFLIDLKNVSNSDKREHNEEIFRFWDPAFWKSKKTQKWYFPRIFLNLKRVPNI